MLLFKYPEDSFDEVKFEGFGLALAEVAFLVVVATSFLVVALLNQLTNPLNKFMVETPGSALPTTAYPLNASTLVNESTNPSSKNPAIETEDNSNKNTRLTTTSFLFITKSKIIYIYKCFCFIVRRYGKATIRNRKRANN